MVMKTAVVVYCFLFHNKFTYTLLLKMFSYSNRIYSFYADIAVDLYWKIYANHFTQGK